MIAKNWTCDRFGDTYVLYFDEQNNYVLLGICRYVSSTLENPINYATVAQVPQLHRASIEDIIDNLHSKIRANG